MMVETYSMAILVTVFSGLEPLFQVQFETRNDRNVFGNPKYRVTRDPGSGRRLTVVQAAARTATEGVRDHPPAQPRAFR
jgi:hypothetical protein